MVDRGQNFAGHGFQVWDLQLQQTFDNTSIIRVTAGGGSLQGLDRMQLSCTSSRLHQHLFSASAACLPRATLPQHSDLSLAVRRGRAGLSCDVDAAWQVGIFESTCSLETFRLLALKRRKPFYPRGVATK
jgi:hypothetical protein